MVYNIFKRMSQSESDGHKLRLSIDIRSLKDHQFTAQLLVKYPSYAPLSIQGFKSAPMPIPNPKVETTLNNCFCFSHFQSDGTDLQRRLQHTLAVELWHYDRLHSDVLLGTARLNLLSLLECPLRKFNESYARVFDAYVGVDESDAEGKPVRTIGALRVLVYLEDQGSVRQLREKGADTHDIQTLLQSAEQPVLPPHLPSQNNAALQLEQPVLPPHLSSQNNAALQLEQPVLPPHLSSQNNAALQLELADLEYKVVWELETWKRAEEAKTRIILQQKEGEFWAQLAEKQKKMQLEKEKLFKKMEANLNSLEGKLKSKMSELMKREQKIVVLEQQLQNKMGEVSKECLSKDEEIDRMKQRHKEERTSMIKEKGSLQIEIAKSKAEIVKYKMQVQEAKKQQDKSVVNVLRSELSNRQSEIKELTMQLQKCNEIKEEYKVYYNKMKEQLISVRKTLAEREQAYKEMKYKKDIAQNNLKNVEQQLAYERSLKQQQSTAIREEEDYDFHPTNQRERLIRARQDLLNQGIYSPHDDLIKQYDQSIAELS